ncbi:unnamed protein product [Spirodela intermedia]|uniref:Uncharacterized protein n=1 Tax=Spirodela intermedia TaxID=51605 RepID=A0A7I8L2R2_SPIIN|nr:unnamed protein product [Spirodela intermedia]
MVSDSELVRRLQEFLRGSDLTTTTTAAVRRQLEADFGVDLSGKKAFIREQVDLFLQTQFEEDGKGDEDGENAGPKEVDEEEGGEEGGEGDGEREEDDQEEEEDDDEGASNGSSKGKKTSTKGTKEVKRRGGGFTKLCSLSPQLQTFVGASELARTEVVKQLWAYIRKHDLQEPTNKRKIVCDARLQELFNVKIIDMFQMNKALSKHIWPLASDDEVRPKDKRRKSGNSGFLAPLPLSEALMSFFGTGESAMSRADVVKRMWQYIKKNDLQDPTDKRRIICDEKLKKLFEVDSFNGFTVPKLLTPHFIKAEQ